MATIVFRLAVGCAFFLFGRWAYRNPKRLYPRTFYTNPESPLLTRLTRVFASLLMLVGSFSILTLITERLTKGIIGAFAALGLAALATWFLRPQLPQIAQAEAAPGEAAGFLTARGKWFVGISLALATALTIVVVIFVLLHR
jgi:hypothetical protein